METIAPGSLAEGWDNIGLQVGRYDWPVTKIRVALEATEALMSAACSEGVSLLVTHHPLIFSPLKSVDLAEHVGKIIQAAVKNRLAIFCAHTNLDSAPGGVNDVFAEKIGLQDTEALKAPEGDDNWCKVVVFVPAGHEKMILDALFESGTGKMEKYTEVSFRSKGVGTFRPGPGAKPFNGRVGERAESDEYRIEVLVAPKNVSDVISTLRRAHPYDEMAYDVYSTGLRKHAAGLGRIGTLTREMTLIEFAEHAKNKLGLSRVKAAGDPTSTVSRVAVCSGSGRGLIENFLASDAHVYVSGDLGYHDGRRIEAEGRALIDVGHFASEQLIVEPLAIQLKHTLAEQGRPVEVRGCDEERDCFYYV
jgi:dinuclear metal center YbgI/SA1388 family protein